MSEEINKKESLYLVDNEIYLHLKETDIQNGFFYETFKRSTGEAIDTGVISYEEMLDSPIRNPLSCACVLAIQDIGLSGEVVAPVSIRTLDQIKDAKRSYRKQRRNESFDHSIRFITSSYDEKFRIPDGGTIMVQYPDRSYIARCEYIDDYHARIGGEVFHICQFAEILEHGNGKVSPEPEIIEEQAAWLIGKREYLAIQITDDGWDYTLYDKSFREIDGGQIDLESITIQECRNMILEDLGWRNRNLEQIDYDTLDDRVIAVMEQQTYEVMFRSEVAKLAVELDAFVQSFDFHGYSDAVDDQELALQQIRLELLSNDVGGIQSYLKEIANNDLDESVEAVNLLRKIDKFYEHHPELKKPYEIEKSSVVKELRKKATDQIKNKSAVERKRRSEACL